MIYEPLYIKVLKNTHAVFWVSRLSSLRSSGPEKPAREKWLVVWCRRRGSSRGQHCCTSFIHASSYERTAEGAVFPFYGNIFYHKKAGKNVWALIPHIHLHYKKTPRSQPNILYIFIYSPFMQNEYLHSNKYEPNPCGVFSCLLLETKKLTVHRNK